jgi:hypothetical protein
MLMFNKKISMCRRERKKKKYNSFIKENNNKKKYQVVQMNIQE